MKYKKTSLKMKTVVVPSAPRILQSSPTQLPPAASPADPQVNISMDSDVLIILASLLCALICVLGLALIARCAWLRRSMSSSNFSSLQNRRSVMNKGVQKKVLESLPKLSFDAESAAGGDVKLADCAICLSEFEEGELIRVLPQCGHGFHVVCIDTWLGAHSSCPSCRQLVVVPTSSATCQKCASAVVDGGSNTFLP